MAAEFLQLEYAYCCKKLVTYYKFLHLYFKPQEGLLSWTLTLH